MQVSPSVLKAVASPQASESNIHSIVVALNQFGPVLGLDQPHRFAQYLAQIAHESGGFQYDAEVWGPTPAQARYDTRTDLGNTPEKDGDGYKYRGRTGIQITGKSNYQQFYNWCKAKGFNPPDFVANPDLVNTDPWEGLAPLWYWDTRNLNRYADTGDIEMITKRINGGLNGYADRLKKYSQIGLAILGYDYTVSGIKSFQVLARSELLYDADIDGDDGPRTRAAIHQYLVRRGSVPVKETKAAPVSETVPVAPAGAEKVASQRFAGLAAVIPAIFSTFSDLPAGYKLILLGVTIFGVVVLVWKAELIAQRVRAAIKAFGGTNA
jgi:putative chitinase